MKRAFTLVAVLSVTWWTLLVAACLHGSAAGCDTPVYRYAMYRWHPAPYELYYFYEGQPDAEGEKVKAAVEALTGNVKPAANLAFFPVDLQKDKELTGVPPDVKDAWGKQSPQPTPWYLMSSPVGMHMFGGTITESEVASLIDSPLRQEIGQLLEQGQAGVYVLVTCDNAAANEAAEKEIRGVMDEVAAGKIALYAAPQAAAEGDAPKPPAAEFGFLKVGAQRRRREMAGRMPAGVGARPARVHRAAGVPGLRSRPGTVLLPGKRHSTQQLDSGCRVHQRRMLVHRQGTESGRRSADPLRLGLRRGSAVAEIWLRGGQPLSIRWRCAVSGTGHSHDGTAGSAPERGAGQRCGEQDQQRSCRRATDVAAGVEPAANERVGSAAGATTASEPDAPPVKAAASPQVAANSPPAVAAPSAELKRPPTSGRAVLWVGAGLLGALVLLFGATFLVLRPR